MRLIIDKNGDVSLDDSGSRSMMISPEGDLSEGFGLQPQSPDPDLLERAGSMGTLDEGIASKLGLAPPLAPTSVPAVPRSGLTVVPQGGEPREGTMEQAQALKVVEPILSNRGGYRGARYKKPSFEDVAGRALTMKGIRMISHLPNMPGNLVNLFAPGTVPPLVEAEPEELRGAFEPGGAEAQYGLSRWQGQDRPYAQAAGEMGADVLALAGLKMPMLPALRRTDINLTNKLVRAEHAAGHAAPGDIAEGAGAIQKFWQQKIASPRFINTTRGLMRGGEATLEGLAIGILNEDDPLATAGLATMGQAAGSGMLHLANLRKPTSSKWHNAVIKSVYLGGLLSLITGGWIVSDLEAGFDKTKVAAVLASATALSGFGRARGGGLLSTHMPRIMDTVTSIPRQTAISYMNSYVSADDRTKKEKMKRTFEMISSGKVPLDVAEKLIGAKDGPSFIRLMDRLVGRGTGPMSKVSQWSTTAGSNNSSPPDGWPENMARSAVNDAAREMMSALARWYKDQQGTLLSTGSGTAYAVVTNNAHAAIGDQMLFAFRAHTASTGAATLNVDSTGAKNIRKFFSTAIASGDIQANQIMLVIYNANQDLYEWLNAPTPVAVQADMETATSVVVGVTPGRMQYHPGVAKAWGQIANNGVSATLTSGHNIASVSRSAEGTILVTFTTAFSSANAYAVFASANTNFADATAYSGTKTTTTVIIKTYVTGIIDDISVDIVAFGDQ